MGKKILFLLRHAKAITGDLHLPDIDRPLSEKGLKDASRLGERLSKKGINFDLIIASPAIRSITTAQHIINKLEMARSGILIDHQVYGADETALLHLISQVNKKYDEILIIGHNPGLMRLASILAGEPVAFPTCSIVRIIFDCKDWKNTSVEKVIKFTFLN